MTPMHPGFFLPWLGYAAFIAAALRWFIDIFLLVFLVWRECQTPSIPRLEREVSLIPWFMIAGVGLMVITLLPKQKAYARAIPVWIGEALLALVPIALVFAIFGLALFSAALRYACK
jgi:hypothetical protein